MQGYVGITDYDWFSYLASLDAVDEVNFWKPGGGTTFSAISPGAPFFFKLHAPRNVVAGGGFFVHFTRLPTSLAWDAFGSRNGAVSLTEMRRRIEKYRRTPPTTADYTIGCVLLGAPFFFEERDWIPVPDNWSPSIVQGKRYDLTQPPGSDLWNAVQVRLLARQPSHVSEQLSDLSTARYGQPTTILPRLGQGIFRVVVTDAYGRRCTMTGERTLPVLDAAHIRPFSAEGENRVPNGLLLRSDLHRLFDRGYLSVTPAYKILVSRRIREEFENGRDYYALRDQEIRLPDRPLDRPDPKILEWHADSVFLG